MKKKMFSLSLLSLLLLTGCANYAYPDFGNLPEGKKWSVGILKPVTHDALDAAEAGFISALATAGWESGVNVTITSKNAMGSSSDQMTMAKSLISSCDLVLGIGTGATQDLKSVQRNKGTKLPILFTAVTDPVGSSLVKSLASPGGLLTGASDAQPIDAQISLIKECLPDADKVGIFYTQSEPNSVAQAKDAKDAIEAAGMTAVIKTCSNQSDVSSNISALAQTSGIDAIYLPTDNNVASNMNYVKNAAETNHVLLVAGEENMVTNGAHITLSISYSELGKRTGEIAATILEGTKKPDEIAVVTMSSSDCTYVMSSVNLAAAGISIPSSVTDKCTDLDDGE